MDYDGIVTRYAIFLSRQRSCSIKLECDSQNSKHDLHFCELWLLEEVTGERKFPVPSKQTKSWYTITRCKLTGEKLIVNQQPKISVWQYYPTSTFSLFISEMDLPPIGGGGISPLWFSIYGWQLREKSCPRFKLCVIQIAVMMLTIKANVEDRPTRPALALMSLILINSFNCVKTSIGLPLSGIWLELRTVRPRVLEIANLGTLLRGKTLTCQ